MQERASSLRHVRSGSLWAGLLVLGCALAAQVEAKKPPATAGQASFAKTGASELSQRVQAAIARADYAEAHRILDDSYRQAPQPEKLYLLGVLAQAEGRQLESVDLFRRFLSDSGSESAEAQEVAQRAVAAPRPLLGEVLVHGERGSLLSVDDRPVGVLPLSTSQRLVTVEVGRGENRMWMVLGVTPGGISNLHTLSPQAEAPAAQQVPFASLLARQRRAATGPTDSGDAGGR